MSVFYLSIYTYVYHLREKKIIFVILDSFLERAPGSGSQGFKVFGAVTVVNILWPRFSNRAESIIHDMKNKKKWKKVQPSLKKL